MGHPSERDALAHDRGTSNWMFELGLFSTIDLNDAERHLLDIDVESIR